MYQPSTRIREREREGVAIHMQGTVFTLARLNSSYQQELASHPMPEHVDEFNSLVRIKLKHPSPDSYHAGLMSILVSYNWSLNL